jgi:ATP-dependent protease ClpP protease subunit
VKESPSMDVFRLETTMGQESGMAKSGESVLDDADFTPNPNRAIWVQGQLNEALLDRLRPRILELTEESRSPISLFINSSGGQPEVCAEILSLLTRTSQDDERVPRIITIAAPNVGSGAANLLSAGDFAIASPDSTLLYHGGRWPLSDLVAAGECGLMYARTLPTFREKAAQMLSGTSVRRFLFIVSTCRSLFAQHRADRGVSALTDLQCFWGILRGKLSPKAQEVLERAIPIWENYNGLLRHFEKKLRRGRTVTKEKLQRLMIYSSLAFEDESNNGKSTWDGGFGRISDHFYFLNTYIDVGKVCDWVAARPEPQTAGTDVEDEYVLQFRLFFLALCRALQEGENYITATDAVWLGLIDTVREDLTGAHL